MQGFLLTQLRSLRTQKSNCQSGKEKQEDEEEEEEDDDELEKKNTVREAMMQTPPQDP